MADKYVYGVPPRPDLPGRGAPIATGEPLPIGDGYTIAPPAGFRTRSFGSPPRPGSPGYMGHYAWRLDPAPGAIEGPELSVRFEKGTP